MQFSYGDGGLGEIRLPFEAGGNISKRNVLSTSLRARQRDEAVGNKPRQASARGDESESKSAYKYSSPNPGEKEGVREREREIENRGNRSLSNIFGDR